MSPYSPSTFLLVGPQGWRSGAFLTSLEGCSRSTHAVSYGANALWALEVFDPDVVIISLSDVAAGLETARKIRKLPTGDMYTLVAVGDGDTLPLRDFDLVLPECATCTEWVAALTELDDIWTVQVKKIASLEAA